MIRLVVLALLCVGLGLADPIEKDFHADKTAENSEPPEITFQMVADSVSKSDPIDSADGVLSEYAKEENSEPPEITFQMVSDPDSDSIEPADEVLSEYAQEQKDKPIMEDKDEDSSIDKRANEIYITKYNYLSCKQGDKTYQHGEEWGCLLGEGNPSCVCHDGYINCAQMNCIQADGCKTDPNSKQCCPKCINIQELTSCKQDDKIYKHGEEWGCLLEEGGKPRCYCYNGHIVCADIDNFCPNGYKTDPNSKLCYPKCIDTIQEESSCKLGDKTYKHGEGFGCLLENGKPSCRCNRGHFVCADLRCVFPKGCKTDPNSKQCCPKCIDKDDLSCKQGGKTYRNGERWGCQLGDGKPHCVCHHGQISCAQMNCYRPVGCMTDPKSKQCCPECINTIQEVTSCKQGDKIYKHGEGYGCLLADGWPSCHCDRGEFMCVDVNCILPKGCKRDLNSKQCCPKCSSKATIEITSCNQGDKMYKDGEGYGCLLDDGKPSCRCNRGHFVCADINCILPKGCKTDPNSKQCCPKCINKECKTTKGVECVFPFKYKGKTWNRCTKAGSLWRWCKTADHWGYCDKKQCKRTRYEG